jgi:arylsulfatase A-like enzyme
MFKQILLVTLSLSLLIFTKVSFCAAPPTSPPNIILIMTDDQGWGQTGYYHHPILKTPNLDAMAANGLRFDRFYAGAPVCSPTRASVLTGRANHRTGVPSHGHALRLQERTLPAALKSAGYATAHFGKWHLNGLRGPGVPVLGNDSHNPGAFGFDQWLTVTNFFDIDPLMSRQGKFEEFKGDSSAIIVTEALKFIRVAKEKNTPFLAVIWDGSPHSPWLASEADRKPFSHMD